MSFPCATRRANIAPLVAEIRAVLDGRLDYEIVYVDDGSSRQHPGRDRARCGAIFPRCAASVMRTSARTKRRHPQRRARRRRRRGSRRSTATARTTPPIFRACGRWRGRRPTRRALLIAGQRAKRRDSAVKRWSSRVANGVRARLLGDDTPDTGCGLKLFPRALYLDLPFFDHQHRFLPALVLREGGRVVSVPVNHRPRARGVSNYGTLDRLFVGIADLAGVMWLQRRAGRAAVRE